MKVNKFVNNRVLEKFSSYQVLCLDGCLAKSMGPPHSFGNTVTCAFPWEALNSACTLAQSPMLQADQLCRALVNRQ